MPLPHPLEVCCYCRLVIRDDNAGIRTAKPHYHWDSLTPLRTGPFLIGVSALTFEPTICAEHVGTIVTFEQQRMLCDPAQRTEFLNAPLPSALRPLADALLWIGSRYLSEYTSGHAADDSEDA